MSLEIEDVREGAGPEAKSGDTVEMHYVGSFTDGRQFDSSRDRGQPFAFQVGMGQVIQGFDMAVTGMRPGGIRKVVIPPELGYGERGAGNRIPPNTTLVFEVELVKIRE